MAESNTRIDPSQVKWDGIDATKVRWDSDPPANFNVATNAANEAIASVPDLLLNTPTNLLNLLKAGYGSAATALGRPDMAPELTQNPDLARKGMERLGFIRPENAPRTAGQRVLASTIRGAVGTAMNPASSLQQQAALALTGALSGGAAQGTKEATGSDVAGTAVAMLSPLAINAAGNAARNVAQERMTTLEAQRAPADRALRAGLDAGYKVPPASVKPSLTNKVIESIGGKAATQQDASLNNAQVTDSLARQALRVPPDTPLTPDVTRAVRREAYTAGYEPIKSAGTIRTGRLFRQDLDDIVSKYQGAERSFPGATSTKNMHGGFSAPIPDLVAPLRRKSFDAGDAIDMTAILRENASKAFRTGDTALGKANLDAAKALENQIERSVSGPLLDNFKAARRQMAIAHTVDDAIIAGTGSVDARKFANALQRGEPLSGELKVVAEFAKNYPKAVQTPQAVGSPGVSKVAALASLLTGGGGAAAFGPGGASMAAIPLLAPPAARSLLLSKPYQRGLSPDYSPGIQGLLGTPLSTGALYGPLQFMNQERGW